MLFLYAVLLKLSYIIMYACQLLLLQLLIWASCNLDRFPEAICCCLQSYTVIDVLLIICLLAFFVISADKGQLFVYICYLLIHCLRLFVIYVYGVLVTLPCTYIPTFMVTSANIR